MGDTIRKICYSLGVVVFLGCGIVGLIYKPDEQEGEPGTVIGETVICSLSTETFVPGTDTVEYTKNSEVNIVINEGTITGRTVTETYTYTDSNDYQERKTKLTASGANYTFDDSNLSYHYKRSLESSYLTGVDPTPDAIKANFTKMGYTCK